MIVIFDLDGTVWDSAEGIIRSLEHTFEAFDLPVPDRQALGANLGPPLQTMLGELGMDPGLIDDATLRYRERYVAKGIFEAELYDGIVELLDVLVGAGHRLATATSKGEVPTRLMLDHFGLTERFEFVGAASMDRSAATKPQVIERALGGLGDPPASSCVMVGDRHYDVTGAARFGIPCIGVGWGYGTEEELRDAGAAHISTSPLEVAELVESLSDTG